MRNICVPKFQSYFTRISYKNRTLSHTVFWCGLYNMNQLRVKLLIVPYRFCNFFIFRSHHCVHTYYTCTKLHIRISCCVSMKRVTPAGKRTIAHPEIMDLAILIIETWQGQKFFLLNKKSFFPTFYILII